MLVSIIAFVAGLVVFGFWGGVIAFFGVPVISGVATGISRGIARGRSEARALQAERVTQPAGVERGDAGVPGAAAPDLALSGARLARALRKQNDIDGLLGLLTGGGVRVFLCTA